MKKIYFDTETCGFHGPIVLLQYAIDDGPVTLFNPWDHTVGRTMEELELLFQYPVVGFNLAFDWFHVAQMYTTLQLLPKDALLEEIIEDYAVAEREARLGQCVKPVGCFDIMLHARKGPYQSTMDRNDIRVRRVPTVLAQKIADELSRRIPMNDIYFARKSDPTQRWQVMDVTDDMGDVIPEFKDVCLKFAPSSGLKALAVDTGVGKAGRLHFSDIELPKWTRPFELGYAPYAMAPFFDDLKRLCKPGPESAGGDGTWYKKWPALIEHHIEHWAVNRDARVYAEDDVHETRGLYQFFDEPEINDTDSVLACMVGTVRWHGFKIDIDGIKELRTDATNALRKMDRQLGSPDYCKRILTEQMTEIESLSLRDRQGKLTTKGIFLETISKWTLDSVCPVCDGMGCKKCDDGLIKTDDPHPAAKVAQSILEYRRVGKEINLYEKLISAGRLHASFKVIGTKSTRMSGTDGLNPQGINRETKVRSRFPLADDGMVLEGGDFKAFEVNIADGVYCDPTFHADITRVIKHPQTGEDHQMKIHSIFGTFFFTGMSYWDVQATKGLPNEQDKYGRSKNGVFALLYYGEVSTLMERVGIDEKAAQLAFERIQERYPVFAEKRKMYADKFCSMKQPDGLGTKVIWSEPDDYIESLLGFRRYFTLENKICKVLFNLANDPPQEWLAYKFKVTRRSDRGEQTAAGACRSALFAAAFQVQASNMRAAGNHVIQSTGGGLTKILQRNIWDLQPVGVNDWTVVPFNVHDEIMCPTAPEKRQEVRKVVTDFIDEYRSLIPLLDIDWGECQSWAEK